MGEQQSDPASGHPFELVHETERLLDRGRLGLESQHLRQQFGLGEELESAPRHLDGEESFELVVNSLSRHDVEAVGK